MLCYVMSTTATQAGTKTKTNKKGRRERSERLPLFFVFALAFVAVVPVYIERINDLNFKISINDPINFSKDDSIDNITFQLNQILEKMILKKPEQWIWSHNRWK